MARKDPPRVDTSVEKPALRHNPFAALAGVEAKPGPASVEPEPPAPAPVKEARPGKSRGRLVLRRETKHRGGKAVVVVTGFGAIPSLDAAAVGELAAKLKKALGCGGTVEETNGDRIIVIQGDRPAAVAEKLRAEGFRVEGVTS